MFRNRRTILLIFIIIISISFPLSYQQNNDKSTVDPWSFGTTDLIAITAIIIPTAVGAYTTTYISNEWQKRKETREIKRQILHEYDDGVVRYGFRIQTFLRLMTNAYLIIDENVMIEEGKLQNSHWEFPDSPEEQPKTRFKDDYSKLSHDIDSIFNAIWKFESSVQFYCENYKDLKKEYDDIIKKTRGALLEAQKAYFATNKENFRKHSSEFRTKYVELQSSSLKFRESLLDVQIKKSIFHK